MNALHSHAISFSFIWFYFLCADFRSRHKAITIKMTLTAFVRSQMPMHTSAYHIELACVFFLRFRFVLKQNTTQDNHTITKQITGASIRYKLNALYFVYRNILKCTDSYTVKSVCNFFGVVVQFQKSCALAYNNK